MTTQANREDVMHHTKATGATSPKPGDRAALLALAAHYDRGGLRGLASYYRAKAGVPVTITITAAEVSS